MNASHAGTVAGFPNGDEVAVHIECVSEIIVGGCRRGGICKGAEQRTAGGIEDIGMAKVERVVMLSRGTDEQFRPIDIHITAKPFKTSRLGIIERANQAAGRQVIEMCDSPRLSDSDGGLTYAAIAGAYSASN